MDAFLDGSEAAPGQSSIGFPLDALRRQLRSIAAAFASPAGRSTAALIAAAQNDSELAKVFRNRFIMKSRETGHALLLQAMQQGAVRTDLDLDVALDLIYAPLYFRLLIGHGALDRDFTDALLDMALEGCARL
jgi:hypothetical protein